MQTGIEEFTGDNKVLIVDDDPDLIKLVSAWLGKRGYAAVHAVDAMTCMTSAIAHKPDVIILDLGLPAGGGLVALERLKRNAQTSMIPVIVLTARNTATARAEVELAGAFRFLPKQGNKDALLCAVGEACDEKEIPDSF